MKTRKFKIIDQHMNSTHCHMQSLEKDSYLGTFGSFIVFAPLNEIVENTL
jgi:hypothetical protein